MKMFQKIDYGTSAGDVKLHVPVQWRGKILKVELNSNSSQITQRILSATNTANCFPTFHYSVKLLNIFLILLKPKNEHEKIKFK